MKLTEELLIEGVCRFCTKMRNEKKMWEIVSNPNLIARPPMDGHISGTMRKPVKFSFQFIARLPMDGHISGTMRKPVKFSFQNIRQNWKIIGSQNVMVNAMGALSPEVDPKSRKNQLSIIPNYAFAHSSPDRRWMGTVAVFCFRFCCLCIHIIMCCRSKH